MNPEPENELMYVIVVRLLPADAGSPRPATNRFRRWLEDRPRHGVDVGHVYAQSDREGVSLVLYLTAADLAQAEDGTYALINDLVGSRKELAGWTISHCKADLIPETTAITLRLRSK